MINSFVFIILTSFEWGVMMSKFFSNLCWFYESVMFFVLLHRLRLLFLLCGFSDIKSEESVSFFLPCTWPTEKTMTSICP